jgi:uncharacterized protein (TIGR03437 family)
MMAQTTAGGSITQVGYQAARPVMIAPGQVVHLRLHGITTNFTSTEISGALPLPSFFNGMSVTLQRSGLAPEAVTLLRLDGLSSCTISFSPNLFGGSAVTPCTADSSYDLWVQIPFDLVPNGPGADEGPCVATAVCGASVDDAVLTVGELAGQGMSVRVLPVVDQVHILNSCADNIGTVGIQGTSVFASYACLPAITHGDNSWVTAANPAKPGEELVAYAFGLGAPATIFDTSGATPVRGVALAKPFTISFPGIASSAGGRLDYVGLVGGVPGLYQVNFHVPSVPATLAPCTTSGVVTQLATTPFNFTMSLMGTASMDQASFCVHP